MMPLPSNRNDPICQKLTPKYVFGGVWEDYAKDTAHVEIALCSVVATVENLLLIDHCAVLYYDTIQPMIPVLWFRYLQLSGQPPTIDLLHDTATPIEARLHQMVTASPQAVYPIGEIFYPKAFLPMLTAPEGWTPVAINRNVSMSVFRQYRSFDARLRRAPLQFRDHPNQFQEVYSSEALQCAIGLVMANIASIENDVGDNILAIVREQATTQQTLDSSLIVS